MKLFPDDQLPIGEERVENIGPDHSDWVPLTPDGGDQGLEDSGCEDSGWVFEDGEWTRHPW